jgi:hypothetical protein
MSTKTNFKRIALVAVASLGLGLFSSVPVAQASTGLTLTVVNGTAGLSGVRTDSTNAATVNISGIISALDSVIVTVVAKTVPAGATALPVFQNLDSTTPTAAYTIDTMTDRAVMTAGHLMQKLDTSVSGSVRIVRAAAAADVYIDQKLGLQLDSLTGTRPAGTYTYTVILKSYEVPATSSGGTLASVTISKDVTITITAAATDSKVASAATSTAVMSQGTTDGGSTVDSAVSVAATASTTANAVILVTLKNVAGGTAARESITATTTVGTIGDGTTQGRSVTLAYTGAVTLQLRADGTAGTATINISSPSVTFAAKTAVFYATTASTGVATKRVNTLSTGSNAGAITAVFKDANGNVIGGNTSVYAFSDALTVVSETASACTYDAANSRHTCSLTGVTAGTANITIGNAGKTVVSAAIPVTVSTAAPATLKMAWNKATYAPGEKAFLSVWAVDSTGKPVGSRTIPQLLAGGISTTAGFSGTGTPSIPNSTTSFALAPKLADTDGLDSLEPVYLYTVYMPSAGGAVTVSATGGGSLPAAGQVEVKATATVTDSGAAALAAVNALATTVASLKTLITTLTNLVLKIQKKVKA